MTSTVDTATTEAIEVLMAAGRADMIRHRNEAYPEEAVGIICADGSTYPLINQARSAHRFEVSQVFVVEAIKALNEAKRFPVAVYHSHPESSSGPSARDVSLMQAMNGALSIIVGIDGITGWAWDGELISMGWISLTVEDDEEEEE